MSENDPKQSQNQTTRIMTTRQALQLAIQHQQAGRLSEAESIYRQILAQQPNHADALNLLGVIESRKGRYTEAVELIRRAIAVNPSAAAYHNNLGITLGAQGQSEAAAEAYREAIRLRPEFAEAHNNLGNVFKRLKKLPEATGEYRRAIEYKPDYAEAHNNLGNALKDQNQLQEAIGAYRWAIGFKPNLAEAHKNLGMALWEVGKFHEAMEAYRQAIRVQPDYAEAHNKLGAALLAQNQFAAAASSFQESLRLKPDYAEAHNSLGVAFKAQNQFDEAIGEFRRAIECQPDFAVAYNNLGNALNDRGEAPMAIKAYRRAIELKSDYHEAHSNLVYILHFDPDYDAKAIYKEYGFWNQQYAEPLKKFIRPHDNARNPDRKLRIGYVSADFCQGSSSCFLVPLLGHHDHEHFEIFCYSNSKSRDAITERMRSMADQWRDITRISDQEAAQKIREDQIDILVDLSLHTAGNRLLVFARKPAPVQVTWLGYPGTTGLKTMDYRLTDPYLDPAGLFDACYSELSIRLPNTFWCYDRLTGESPPGINALPALQNGHITFGSLYAFVRVNDPVLLLWKKVLTAIPDSHLILHAPLGLAREHVLDVFGQDGISAQRVEFTDRMPLEDYLKTYHKIDIVLDPFPYTGGTTGLDALWMGVPVVTLMGKTVVGRGGWSQLCNLGLKELAAPTPQEYVNIAVKLAGDLPRLQELRSTLRGRMEASPLMDAPSFARNVEAAYRVMWRRWLEKQGA
jgi:protein O-GlcNAc transferase